METWEVLNGAAEQLEKRGWTQGKLSDYKGNMCARGALSMAACGCPAFFSLAAVMARKADFVFAKFLNPDNIAKFLNPDNIGYVSATVPDWNNAPGRTKDEVVTALRACAAIEKAKLSVDQPQRKEIDHVEATV